MLLGIVTTLITLGMYFVDAVVLTITFNKLAPALADTYGLHLPFTHVGLWPVFGAFIVVYYAGKFVQMLTPSVCQVTQKSEKSQ